MLITSGVVPFCERGFLFWRCWEGSQQISSPLSRLVCDFSSCDVFDNTEKAKSFSTQFSTDERVCLGSCYDWKCGAASRWVGELSYDWCPGRCDRPSTEDLERRHKSIGSAWDWRFISLNGAGCPEQRPFKRLRGEQLSHLPRMLLPDNTQQLITFSEFILRWKFYSLKCLETQQIASNRTAWKRGSGNTFISEQSHRPPPKPQKTCHSSSTISVSFAVWQLCCRSGVRRCWKIIREGWNMTTGSRYKTWNENVCCFGVDFLEVPSFRTDR